MVFVAADGNAGSGAVIGKNTVLTAAHVVKKILENTNKDSIYVIPGRNGAKLPYGKFKIKSVHIPQSYIDHAGVDTDIAVITVDSLNSKSIGEVVPVLPLKLSNSIENGVSLTTTGFPGGMATVFLTNFIRCRTSFRMLFRLSLTMSLLGCDDLRQELTVKVRLPR
ncbi:hypothetical protein D3I35_11985 [Enterococcus faecium]|nr:hypothetical protein [Enterococcus faecium]